MTVFTVERCWRDGAFAPAVLVAGREGFRLTTDSDGMPEGHLGGSVFTGFRDHHVHLGLIDGALLEQGGIAAVDDFGWSLSTVQTWSQRNGFPEVRFAGQLLTAPGGYPVHSGWAPRDAALEVATPSDAAAAVDTQLDAGASFIKIALNADVGPVLGEETLAAIVLHAHARGVRVAAHAQGAGQAERAFAAGVDILAHAPWSEPLADKLISDMAASMTWVSTLDIHGWGDYGDDFDVASDNVRRFHAAGGDIRYGTDLGNGPLPLGINERELLALENAGLGREALVRGITHRDNALALSGSLGHRLSHISGDEHDSPATWLATAHLISPTTIREYLT